IIDENFERIAALAAEHQGDPDAFFVILRSLIDGIVSMYALAVLARSDAKTAGLVRRDLTLDDVLLIMSMGRGAMEGLPDAAARSAVAHRVLALVLSGVEAPRTA